MPTVPIYNGPQAVPQAVPRVNIQGMESPDYGRSLAGVVSKVGLSALERQMNIQAATEATEYSFRGRDELDAIHQRAIKGVAVGEDGVPDYDSAVGLYESEAAKVAEKWASKSNNKLAQSAIIGSLNGYAQTERTKIVRWAADNRVKTKTAFFMDQAVKATQDPGLTDVQREERIDQAVTGAQLVGGMNAVEAQKYKAKLRGDMVDYQWQGRINAAQNLSQLDEVQKELATPDRAMSPERNAALMSMMNTRRSAILKQVEDANREKQDDLFKMLYARAKAGQIDEENINKYINDLRGDQFSTLLGLPRRTEKEMADTVDDPVIRQRIQSGIIENYKNPGALTRYRAQVAQFVSGYDPVSRKYGKPALSQSTANSLIADIDQYENRAKQERESGKGERNTLLSKQRVEVESLVRETFKRYIDSRGTDRTAATEAEKRQIAALESLLKDGINDSVVWYDKWKKDNQDIVNSKSPLPSWVVRKADGTPDFAATKNKVTKDFKSKAPVGINGRPMTQSDFDAKFKSMERLEREYAR